MSDKGIEAAARAMKDTFRSVVADIAKMPFTETRVSEPADAVWDRYARAAIAAYFAAAEPVAYRFKFIAADPGWNHTAHERQDVAISQPLFAAPESKP